MFKISAQRIRLDASIIELEDILKNHTYYVFGENRKDAVEKALKEKKLELATSYIMEDKDLDEDRAYALAQDFDRQGLLDDFIKKCGGM